MTLEQLESISKDWGLWVRQGRTVPNRIGHSSSSPLQGISEQARPSSTRKSSKKITAQGTSSPNKNKRTAIPLKFIDDFRERTIDRAVSRMCSSHRVVMSCRYVEGRSLRDVSLRMNLSHSKINRLHGEALAFVAGALTGKTLA